ncbi:MAG TPA: amino acid deaminase [Terracidiphilus sp.]|nr:amino acid deaminase [Terracidiphilus sp.]
MAPGENIGAEANGYAVSSLNKGLGSLSLTSEGADVAGLGWNLLREDLSLPAAVLYRDRLEHNLEWMRRFIEEYGVKLAPHGKTTMAPALFEMQFKSGAWGITVATAHQALVAHAHGVRRVLMANELVGKENMSIISRLLEDPSLDFYCLVDSADLVEQLGSYFSSAGQKLQVLVELGVMGGRAGVRNEQQQQEVLQALARWDGSLQLCGVEIYEGVLDNEESIRGFLRHAVATLRKLIEEKRVQRSPALLTGAGSAWYDVVAEEFSAAGFGDAVEIVLRPGCYLTHDVGSYRKAQTRISEHNPIARKMQSGLKPALQIWAYVQSIPEPEKAIIGMGKRDAAFDSGLPVPARFYRPGTAEPVEAPSHWSLTKMMDQHAFMEIAMGDNVRVGDMIGFDICHPCLTFDKWRAIPIINAEFQVVEVVQTFF